MDFKLLTIYMLIFLFSIEWSRSINLKNIKKIIIENEPIGFASLNDGTTGGAGGDTIIVTNVQQLADTLKPREKNVTDPLVIFVSGTLTGYDDMIDIKRTANVSLLGLGDNAGFKGFGVKIVESSNIIVRNLTFADCTVEEKDGLTVTEGSNNIWIDHCTFTDNPSSDPGGDDHDGLLDIKHGSYNLTVSYNYFTNHRKTALFGHSVKETGDVNMKATYYCNWFNGTFSRHPRTRYGKVHLLNNLYTDIIGYGVGVTCAAQVMLEGNYFENIPIPTLISQVNDPEETLKGDPKGYLKAVSNLTINSGSIVENLSGYEFDPHTYYDYSVIDSHEVKEIVQSMAGAGKVNIGTTIESEKSILPVKMELYQNYPNPFNPETNIVFNLEQYAHVILDVYDITGKKIKTLINAVKPAGRHSIVFDGSGLSSGIYIYRLECAGNVFYRKMMLIK